MVAALSTERSPSNLVYLDFINGRPVVSAHAVIDPGRSGSEVLAELVKNPLPLGTPAADQFSAEAGAVPFCLGRCSPAVIVVGNRTDPFGAIDENLFAAITFLDQLKGSSAARIIVRTRSPYIILAAPALRLLNSAAGGRTATVCLGLEAGTAAHSGLVSRRSPPPAERLDSMRALRDHGIPVIAQFAPFFGSAQTLEASEQFCRQICEASAEVLLVDFERIIPVAAAGKKEPAETAQLAARTFTSARHGRRTRSYIIAEQILTAIAAEKLITADKQHGTSAPMFESNSKLESNSEFESNSETAAKESIAA